ncbi:MAG: glycosyltransferase family 2 protein, partial [Flavobacteriaceae bacterium]|nr:glycosyltransferase family 2 protein [Flavobacteriaceae bacterium]
WEFYIRLLKNGGNALVIHEPLYTYRKRSNTTTDKADDKKYELLKYIYLKHQELYEIHFEVFLNHLLYKLEREEKEKIKNTQRLEFKIGKGILFPLRYIKSLFKK